MLPCVRMCDEKKCCVCVCVCVCVYIECPGRHSASQDRANRLQHQKICGHSGG